MVALATVGSASLSATSPYLEAGPSPHRLGPDTTRRTTPYYQVESWGGHYQKFSEIAPDHYYPTPDDFQPGGLFNLHIDNGARGDFNGDGHEDLATTWMMSPHTVARETILPISVFLNDGNGNLVPDDSIFADGRPPVRRHLMYRILAPDFNGDGRPDLVSGTQGLITRTTEGPWITEWEPVLLCLSGPDGKLHDASHQLEGQEDGAIAPGFSFSHDISVGDVDGDGDIDLYTGSVLWINDGTGHFSLATDQLPPELNDSAKPYLMSSAIGDLNNDGVGDIVAFYADTAPGGSSGYIYLSRDGDPALAGRQLIELPAGLYGQGITKFNHSGVCDLDGDGRLDIVTTITRAQPYYIGRDVQVFMNHGDGRFVDESERVTGEAYLDEAWGEGQLSFADANDDGFVDLVHSSGKYSPASDVSIPGLTIYLNDGTGHFAQMPPSGLAWVEPWQVEGYLDLRPWQQTAIGEALLVDLDGQGALDFLTYTELPLHQWPDPEYSEYVFYTITARTDNHYAPVNSTTRLDNLSVRSHAGSGDATLIAGFVLEGAGTKPLTIRGIGPTLETFGVNGSLADPQLRIFRQGQSSPMADNDNWVADDGRAAGAFPLPAGSRDAVVSADLPGAVYTAHVLGNDGESGVARLEFYDRAAEAEPRLVNLSVRTHVGTQDDVLIVGFNLTGSGPKRLLIRAVGPTLETFGVGGVLADPQLSIIRAGTEVAANDDWEHSPAAAEIRARSVGFPLPDGAKDAALLVTLQPGSYSVVVRGAGETTGIALVELYEVP